MARTIVTLLTWNRWKLTRETLRTFRRYNGNDRDFLVIDNASNDKTVKNLNKRGYEVIVNKRNLGVFRATRLVWLEAYKRGYDFIINLQNDFPSVRPIPYDEIEEYLDINKNVGFVQLNDKGRLLTVQPNGQLKLKRKPRTINIVTRRKLRYKSWHRIGNERFCKSNYHFSFNPNLFRAELIPGLVGEVRKCRERQIMEQFEETGLKASRLEHRCFETIIRKRSSGWGR